MRKIWIAAAAALALAGPAAAQQTAPSPTSAPGDTVRLTLGEALGRALEGSEEVRLARSEVDLANAQIKATRAGALPQLDANLGYTRTFASAFGGGGGLTLPDSLRFSPDSTASLAQRVSYLERNAGLAGVQGIGGLFGSLPFGQENAYSVGISGSQLLYSGGRTGAALSVARSYRSAAQLGLREQESEIELQVRTAYTQALLAQELEGIATAALRQAEAFLEQERLRQRAGQASELDVLRAEVSRDNLRPQLVEARNAAELSLLNLKRLLDIPLARPLRLTTPLEVSRAELGAAPAPAIADADPTSGRAALAAAERQVDIREQGVRTARGAFLPSVSLSMNYGRQLYPTGALNFDGDWRTDFTATLGVSVPIFSGFQRTAELEEARVELERSRLRLSQLRENVRVQYEQARGERERARTAIAARQTTVGAAQRVYDLTLLRYQQGLATQLDVSQARLEALQARTNLAQAVADFQVADARLARAAGAPTTTGTNAVQP